TVEIAGLSCYTNPAEKNEYKASILETVIKANYKLMKKMKEGQTMCKEVLDLFRPEIEAEIEKYKLENDKKTREMIVKLYEFNVPVSQIVYATDLPEGEVLDIIRENSALQMA
ncbi:MAG: hypothetical protein LBS21_14140, partial [Clostridiales bacterium]|nr:hypothetical protein [Clostridiales bacterium]